MRTLAVECYAIAIATAWKNYLGGVTPTDRLTAVDLYHILCVETDPFYRSTDDRIDSLNARVELYHAHIN